MIDHVTLLSYCAIVLGFVCIPGPATLLTIARATTSGIRGGVTSAAGITTGDCLHTSFAVVGLSAIIATSALLFSLIKYAGAAYLVYLGVKSILEKSQRGLTRDPPSVSARVAFRQAILTEILNPKTALFFLAFLPQFVHPENGAPFWQLTELGLLFATIGFLSTSLFALSAARVGNLLRRNAAIWRWQGKVVGAIYLALGLRLALQER